MTDRPTHENRSEAGAPRTITMLLDRAGNGDSDALAEVWTLLYEDLRAMAHRLVGQDRIGNEIDATELLGEAYRHGLGSTDLPTDRDQFLGRVFRHMSQRLIDLARRSNADKRGGGWTRRPLNVVAGELRALQELGEEQREAAAVVMQAWEVMQEDDPREAHVVFCRFSLGLTNEETARLLALTPKQAEKIWYFGRARLRQALSQAMRSAE